MAICNACKYDMLEVDECINNWFIEFPDGIMMNSSKFHFNEPGGRCHDCNVKHGNYHHPGCDVERCPRCGGQLISCGCLDEED